MGDIAKIKLYDKNAKKHPDNQLKQIADSLRRFGWQQPIKLGEEKAYRLADNKLNESEWDMGLAIEELKGLSDEMFELTGFGKDLLISVDEDNFDAQAEYDKIKEPTVKQGDLYQLGEHKLLCGDSTKKESYEKLMGGGLADMVFTDPPYNVGYDYTGIYTKGKKANVPEVRFNDKKKPEEFTNFIYEVFKNCYDFSKKDCPFYQWLASRNESLVRKGTENAGWFISQTIIWLKDRMVFSPGQDYHRIYEPCYFGWKKGIKHFVNKKGHGAEKDFILLEKNDFEEWLDVLYERKDKIVDYIHPTQKPIRLAERALKYHSNTGFIILEPFNGSGSTMMACEQLKRKCYAIELDPKFVQVAIKRWEDYTGQKAIKCL